MAGRFAWLKEKRHSSGPVLIAFGLLAQLELHTGWFRYEDDRDLLRFVSVVLIVAGIVLLVRGWWENRPARPGPETPEE